jgi:hypothetical protein
MKSLYLVLALVLITLTAAASAQSETGKPAGKAAVTEAGKTFSEMKTLAGEWEGPVTVQPAQPAMDDGKPLHITMRVTSRGNALVHEMQSAGTPLDATKYDHPVTMIYLNSDRLNLVHYCDAGNRPHMVARTSPDGKTVEFDFADISGSTEYGHMDHAVFNLVDADHHTEDWTYIMPGNKPIHAHFDLKRVQ